MQKNDRFYTRHLINIKQNAKCSIKTEPLTHHCNLTVGTLFVLYGAGIINRKDK